MSEAEGNEGLKDFIRDRVQADLTAGKSRRGHTVSAGAQWIFASWPCEIHCLNFGIALENGGVCNLRFDDTNPVKEDTEYVDSITEDVQWLIDGWAIRYSRKKRFLLGRF